MKFKKQGKNQDPAIYTAWKKKNQQTNKEKKKPRKQQNNKE